MPETAAGRAPEPTPVHRHSWKEDPKRCSGCGITQGRYVRARAADLNWRKGRALGRAEALAAVRAAVLDEYGINLVDEAFGVAIAAPAEMQVNKDRWEVARAAFLAALDARPSGDDIDPEQAETLAMLQAAMPHKFGLPSPERLDVERLARALDADWGPAWRAIPIVGGEEGEIEGGWDKDVLAAIVAREYAALRTPEETP